MHRGPQHRHVNTRPSPPELRNLELLSHGLTTRHVAVERGVGHETIKTQLKLVRLKLGAKTTTHAVAQAIRRGLIL